MRLTKPRKSDSVNSSREQSNPEPFKTVTIPVMKKSQPVSTINWRCTVNFFNPYPRICLLILEWGQREEWVGGRERETGMRETSMCCFLGSNPQPDGPDQLSTGPGLNSAFLGHHSCAGQHFFQWPKHTLQKHGQSYMLVLFLLNLSTYNINIKFSHISLYTVRSH